MATLIPRRKGDFFTTLVPDIFNACGAPLRLAGDEAVVKAAALV